MRPANPPPVEVSCLGKDKMPTMALASEVASRMAKRHGRVIKPYQCEHCGFYHVGEIAGKGVLNGKQRMRDYNARPRNKSRRG